MSPYAAATLPGLSTGARLAMIVLDRLARGHDECWHATRKIAAELKVCERTARSYLAELSGAAIIEVVRDYSLKTRRRIRLLWKQPRESLAFVTANLSVQVTANVSPESPPPPGPPLEEPDGALVVVEEPGLSPALAPSDPEPPAEVPPTPPPLSQALPGETPPPADPSPAPAPTPAKATPEQVARLVAEAKAIVPQKPESWVRALARRCGYRPAAEAVVRARGKGTNHGKPLDGYIARTAAALALEGAVEHDPLAPAATASPPPAALPSTPNMPTAAEEVARLRRLVDRPDIPEPVRLSYLRRIESLSIGAR